MSKYPLLPKHDVFKVPRLSLASLVPLSWGRMQYDTSYQRYSCPGCQSRDPNHTRLTLTLVRRESSRLATVIVCERHHLHERLTSALLNGSVPRTLTSGSLKIRLRPCSESHAVEACSHGRDPSSYLCTRLHRHGTR